MIAQKTKKKPKRSNPIRKFKEKFPDIFRKYRQDSLMLKIRMILVYVFTLISYTLLIYFLYFQDRILISLIWLFIFFALFHFAFIDLRHRGLRQFWYIFGLFIIIERILLGFQNWEILTSITILNVAAIILALRLDGATSDKRKFRSRSFFAVGGYIFTVFSVIAYSLFLIGGSSFSLSCDTLQENSTKFVAFWSHPFERGWEEVTEDVKNSQEKVKQFFDAKLGEFLPSKEQISLQTPYETNINSGENVFSPLVTKFHNIQANIDNMIQENTLVNMGICDLVLNEIESRSDQTSFQLSVLILMFILLYPFVRLAFFVISFLSLIVFKILYWLKVYKVHTIEEEIEEIV